MKSLIRWALQESTVLAGVIYLLLTSIGATIPLLIFGGCSGTAPEADRRNEQPMNAVPARNPVSQPATTQAALGGPTDADLRNIIESGMVRGFNPGGPMFSLHQSQIDAVRSRPEAALRLLEQQLQKSKDAGTRVNAYDFIAELVETPVRDRALALLAAGETEDNPVVHIFIKSRLEGIRSRHGKDPAGQSSTTRQATEGSGGRRAGKRLTPDEARKAILSYLDSPAAANVEFLQGSREFVDGRDPYISDEGFSWGPWLVNATTGDASLDARKGRLGYSLHGVVTTGSGRPELSGVEILEVSYPAGRQVGWPRRVA